MNINIITLVRNKLYRTQLQAEISHWHFLKLAFWIKGIIILTTYIYRVSITGQTHKKLSTWQILSCFLLPYVIRGSKYEYHSRKPYITVVKNAGSRANLPGSEFWLSHLGAVWPRKNDLTSLGLEFPQLESRNTSIFLTKDTIRVVDIRDVTKIKFHNTWKTLGTCLVLGKYLINISCYYLFY